MRFIRGLLAIGIAAAVACGDSTGPRTGPPANLVRVDGHNQQGTVGATLANELVLRVTDADGNPVRGTTVDWSVTAGGGSVDPAQSTTDAEGEARATWTLGPSIGTQSVSAAVSDLTPLVFQAQALAGPLAILTDVSGAGQSAPGGCPVPEELVVRATDEFGNPLAGVTIEWSVTGGGLVDPETSETGEDGEASALWLLGPDEGPQTVTAAAGGMTADFAGTGTAPPTLRDGTMSVDYEGDHTGAFEASSDFRICPGGFVTSAEWAFSFFDSDDGLQFLLATSPRENGRADLILIFIDGQVTTTGEITWDFNACDAGFDEMCGADGFLALDFPVDGSIDEAQTIYFFDTGTIDFTTVTADRLVGTFQAEGFEYGQGGLPTGAAIDATDGAFDLPVVAEVDILAAPAATAAAEPGLHGDAAAAARRLADRLPRRQ